MKHQCCFFTKCYLKHYLSISNSMGSPPVSTRVHTGFHVHCERSLGGFHKHSPSSQTVTTQKQLTIFIKCYVLLSINLILHNLQNIFGTMKNLQPKSPNTTQSIITPYVISRLLVTGQQPCPTCPAIKTVFKPHESTCHFTACPCVTRTLDTNIKQRGWKKCLTH